MLKEAQETWRSLSERERLVMLAIGFQRGSSEHARTLTHADVMELCALPENEYREVFEGLDEKGLVGPRHLCYEDFTLNFGLYPISHPDPYIPGW